MNTTSDIQHAYVNRDYSNFLRLFDNLLCDDIVDIVKSKISPEIQLRMGMCSKYEYIKNHKLVQKMIPLNDYNDYLHDIVKHDCAFVFGLILNEKFDKFHKWKPFYNKSTSHPSFLIYLRDYARMNMSDKCVAVIDKIAQEKGFAKNWYRNPNRVVCNSIH